MATQASIDAVQKLFIAFYQRPADVTGLEYWANRVDAAGGDTSAVVNAFATSAEATALYPATLSTTQLVNNVYMALFGRAPDAAGLNFYANAIAAGTMTPGKLAQNILDGATGTDATIVANKLTVAKAYTAAMDTTAEILAYNGNNGNNALANAKALLTNVNALDTSVTNATGQIPAIMVNNVNNAAATITAPGTAFTFTSGIDSYTGTANADLVSGAIADIGATDAVDGAAGTADKLTLTTAGTLTVGGVNSANFEQLVLANGTNTITLATDIAAAATSNNFNVITGGTGTDTIVTTNAAQAINLTTVTAIEQITTTGANAFTFSGAGASGLTLLSTVGGSTINLGNFTNAITVAGGHAKTVNGGTGTDTLTLSGTQGANIVTISGVENVNGSSSVESVTLAAAGTVNFSGIETITGGAVVNTVNLGTSTTGVTYVHANGGLLDTVNLNASNATADTIALNGGTGVAAATDKLTVSGFTSAHDVIRLDADFTTVALSGIQAISAAGNITVGTGAPSAVTVLNFELGGATNVIGTATDGTALLSNLGTITVTANDSGYIVAYDAGNAYLFRYLDTGNTALVANEITLVGTFNGVAVGALGAANFAEA